MNPSHEEAVDRVAKYKVVPVVEVFFSLCRGKMFECIRRLGARPVG